MWPRSEDRGNYLRTYREFPRELRLQCGLGPKTEEMRREIPYFVASTLRLQCGLGPKTEEISTAAAGSVTANKLQCGLGPKTEEMPISNRSPGTISSASMWPRSEDRGNVNRIS